MQDIWTEAGECMWNMWRKLHGWGSVLGWTEWDGRRLWHAWEIIAVHTRCSCEFVNERENLEDVELDGKIILILS